MLSEANSVEILTLALPYATDLAASLPFLLRYETDATAHMKPVMFLF